MPFRRVHIVSKKALVLRGAPRGLHLPLVTDRHLAGLGPGVDLLGPIACTEEEVASSAARFNDEASNFTFSGDNITNGTANRAMRVETDNQFEGDFDVRCIPTSTSGGWGVFGVYDIAEDSTYSQTDQEGGMDSMTVSYHTTHGGNINYGGSTEATWTPTATDELLLRRRGTTVSLLHKGAVVRTFSNGTSATLRLVVAAGNSIEIYRDFNWTNPSCANHLTNTTQVCETDGGNIGWTNVTVWERNFDLANDAIISRLAWKTANTESNAEIYISERTSSTNYRTKFSMTVTHGGTGIEWFDLATPYTVPSSGTFRIGVWSGSDAHTSKRGSTNEAVFAGKASTTLDADNSVTEATNGAIYTCAQYAAYQ
jgi:hypothetical protein